MFGNVGPAEIAPVLLWLSLLSFFNLGAWGVLYSYTPELYPTSVRASGFGVAAAVARIGGVVGPEPTPLPVGPSSLKGTFAIFVAPLFVNGPAVSQTRAPNPTRTS